MSILQAAIAAANGHIETFTLATYQIIQATSDVENVTKIMEKYTARHEALKKEKDERMSTTAVECLVSNHQ
jgi:Cu/Ag efflux protein CusF